MCFCLFFKSLIIFFFFVIILNIIWVYWSIIYFDIQLFHILTIVIVCWNTIVLITTCSSARNVLLFGVSIVLASLWAYCWLYSSCTGYRPLISRILAHFRCIIFQTYGLLCWSRRKISSINLSILLYSILFVFSLSFQLFLYLLCNFIIHCQFTIFTRTSIDILSNSISWIRFLSKFWSTYLTA